MKLSLIVPCYNEENNAAPFCRACREAFSAESLSYEIIFVNDGSTDGTEKALRTLYGEDDNITVISFSRNFGKEAAMLAGMEKAVGDYVTLIDADLQQQPRTVVEMVKLLDAHPEYDCVAAYQQKRSEGGFRGICKSAFYRIMNFMSEVELHPAASDFRTMRRSVTEAVLSLSEYHRFSKGIFSWVGFETCYIPYIADKRLCGKSSWSFKKLFGYSVDGITNYSVSPLRLPLYFGGAAVLLSAVWFFVSLFSGTLSFSDTRALFIAILFLWGLSSIFKGISGIYLAKDYTENKHRPKYIVKSCLDRQEKKK